MNRIEAPQDHETPLPIKAVLVAAAGYAVFKLAEMLIDSDPVADFLTDVRVR